MVAYNFLYAEKTKDIKKSVFAGIVFGLALLSKYTGVFLIPIYILLGLWKIFLKKIKLANFVVQFLIVCVVGLFIQKR